MELRSYQQSAKAAFYSHLETRDDAPCIVIPTGGGKTPLLASICSDVHRLWQGRILVLAHVKELLEQAKEKLLATDPTLPIGVYSAGLKSRQLSQPITIGGIQSVYQRAHEFLPFDLILIDEAHLIPADGDGMYQRFLKDAKICNPNVRIGGLTATPFRLDVGSICGPDKILNHICYEVGIKELIRDGYLCRVKSRPGEQVADLSNVKIRAGEFIPEQAAQAFDDGGLVDSACREVIELAADRHGVLVFCSSVEHGEHVESKLRELGQDVGFIHGETPDADRDRLILAFKQKRLRWLVNVNVLTTGFDAQHVDCVVLLRATMSAGLYYQMVGRGFRTHPGKADCLILDYGGNIIRHGPVDAIKIKKPGKGEGAAPVKPCPSCKCFIHASYMICPECGFNFPPHELKHGSEASTAGVISGQATETEFSVSDVRYRLHTKRGTAPGDAPPTLRVDYKIGWEKWSSEWVCIEHEGFARTKAEKWWAQRTTIPCPVTVAHAVKIADAGGLSEPTSITVREVAGDKFDRIVKAELAAPFEPGDSFELPIAEFGEFDELGSGEEVADGTLEAEELPF